MTVAVLGTGSIGMQYLQALRTISDAQPVAVPIRPERREELRKTGVLVASDLADARSMGTSMCIIATDTGRHVADGIQAIEAGMDTLVEKPLAADAAGARLLCATAERAGRRLFVGAILRFSASLNAFRELLSELGSIHHVRVECQSYLPRWRPDRDYRQSYSARKTEGGVLRDLVHEIDYTGWLFGWPSELQACLNNTGRLGVEAEEAADLIWNTSAGCTVSMRLDYLTAPDRRRITATGERGVAEWDGIQGTAAIETCNGPHRTLEFQDTRHQMITSQLKAMIAAKGQNSDPRLANGAAGANALCVCDAARRASERGSRETVTYL